MRHKHALLPILAVLLCGSGHTQHVSPPAAVHAAPPPELALQEGTPAQQSISAARLQIKSDPKRAQPYNALALGFIRRARETGDTRYLGDAEAALAQGLKLDPEDFQLQRTEVALMLSRQEFAQARERATVLHRRTPDDVMIYGYIAEADIALGKYSEAEANAQWMLNLRPNNIPGLLIGAELRTLLGDSRGALDFLNLAYSETSPTEFEELAWIANQIASTQIDSGQINVAAQVLERAERLFPRYPYTMENLGSVRLAQNRASDAVQLLMQAEKIDSNPHTLYRLARAQQAAGQSIEAQASFAKFRSLASEPGRTTDESRLDLILLDAENPAAAPNALKLAQQEMTARQGVWTLDAYSWALYANAKYQEADEAEQKAIGVGVRSAQIFDHAGHIAQKLNRDVDAKKYFGLAVESDSASAYAADALQSSKIGAVAKNPHENTSEILTSPSLLEPAVPRNYLTPSAQPAHAAMQVEAEGTASTPVFAPVPDAFLTPHPTGTDRIIRTAQATVARIPTDAKAYAGLGAAYFQRARETGDVTDYQLAEQSLNKSLDLVSSDFSADAALETMAEVCMGEHRFTDALTYSQKALSLGTGDVSSFAIVGDAYADMGEYDKAALAYSRLTPHDMTLSPRSAYARDSRISYLKFIAGDTAGAIALMKSAVAEGIEAQLQSENLAWLYYELGEYSTQAGDIAAADRAYVAALAIHPGDYRALAALGKLRANNGRYDEAVVLYQRAIAVVPMPIFIAELGDLYAKTGNLTASKKQYALVEYIGLLGHINQVLHNRDLALFYADHDTKLAEALALAQKELEVRQDVYTWDALAWTLYKNGKVTEAADASQKALRFGTRDPLLLFHAGMIAERSGQPEKARAALQEALQINRRFHLIYAATAQKQLNALAIQSASKEGPDQHAR